MMTVNRKAGILHYSNSSENRTLPALGLTLPGDPLATGRAIHLQDPSGQYMAGSCTSEGVDMRLDAFPWIELSIVEAGELHLHGEGFELNLLPGDCFVIPRGASLHWRHEGQLKRLFMAFSALQAGAGMPLIPFKIDLAQPLAPCDPPAASVLLTPAPKAWSQTLFMADSLRIGLWQCEPYVRRQVEPNYSELMFILEGSVTLTTEDGERYRVQAGETIVVPQGATNAWASEDQVRKVFCILS
jgi:uncharacterized cupin superfamily protein